METVGKIFKGSLRKIYVILEKQYEISYLYNHLNICIWSQYLNLSFPISSDFFLNVHYLRNSLWNFWKLRSK